MQYVCNVNTFVTINAPLALVFPQFAVLHCLSDCIIQLLLRYL